MTEFFVRPPNGRRMSDGRLVCVQATFPQDTVLTCDGEGKPFIAYIAGLAIHSAYRADPRTPEARAARRDLQTYGSWCAANGPEVAIEVQLIYNAKEYTEEQARRAASLDLIAILREQGFEGEEGWLRDVLPCGPDAGAR